MDWIKFGFAFCLFVIVPVWIFEFVDISLMWKIGFTAAGAFGIWIALEKGTIGRRH